MVEESKNNDPPVLADTASPQLSADHPASSAGDDSPNPTPPPTDMDLEAALYDGLGISAGDGGTNTPSVTPSVSALDTTIQNLELIIQRETTRLLNGDISELSPVTMQLFDRLVSLKQSVSSSQSSAPSMASLAEVLSHRAPRRVSITAADVKQLPRLNGSTDVDVISALSQFRVVCSFRVKAAAPTTTTAAEIERMSDQAAFEHVSLICDGPILQLYQQISDGCIDWQNPNQLSFVTTTVPGAHTAPSNWAELKTALYSEGPMARTRELGVGTVGLVVRAVYKHLIAPFKPRERQFLILGCLLVRALREVAAG